MNRTLFNLLPLVVTTVLVAGFAPRAWSQDSVVIFDSADFTGPLYTVLPPSNFGAGTSGSSITVNGSGTQSLTGGNSYTGGTSVSGGTLTVNNNGSGSSGGLTVTSGTTPGGAGTILLSGAGANTYTGGTTISGGTLTLNNGSGSLAGVTVSSGTLSGTTVIVLSGGATLDSSGTLTLSGTNTYTGGMPITTSGTLSSGGTASTLTVTDLAGTPGVLPDNAGTTEVTSSMEAADVAPASVGKFVASGYAIAQGDSIAFDGETGTSTLTLSVVPEPSTWTLLLTGLVLLAGWRRAKRTRA